MKKDRNTGHESIQPLDTPVALTPDQLERVAAGAAELAATVSIAAPITFGFSPWKPITMCLPKPVTDYLI